MRTVNQPHYPVKILSNIKDVCKLDFDFELSLNHRKKSPRLKITIARQHSQRGWGTVVINNSAFMSQLTSTKRFSISFSYLSSQSLQVGVSDAHS